MLMCLGGKAGCTLDHGDGGLARDVIVGHREVGTLMEGGFTVQGGEETARSEEKADPANGGVGEALVPKEEFLLGGSEVAVGGVEDG